MFELIFDIVIKVLAYTIAFIIVVTPIAIIIGVYHTIKSKSNTKDKIDTLE